MAATPAAMMVMMVASLASTSVSRPIALLWLEMSLVLLLLLLLVLLVLVLQGVCSNGSYHATEHSPEYAAS